ncbi:MAG: DUF4886 domain-containing protein [Prevotella sp.]|nr:DUF4886 domain-containing protein [Prevotella sp.]
MKLFNLSFFFFFLSFMSCSGSDDDFAEVLNNVDTPTPPTTVHNVLVIGNSASRDAFSYVPALMEEMDKNNPLNMLIFYKGSESLAGHYNRMIGDYSDFESDVNLYRSQSVWQTFKGERASTVLGSKKWDLVILQNTWSSNRLDVMRQSVQDIRQFLTDNFGAISYALMLDPPNPKKLSDDNLDDQWGEFASIAETLLQEGLVDFVIPCGTAIQNALHTHLKVLGDYGYLSYEGTHLQEGLPCLLEAYTAAQCLAGIFNTGKSIESSRIRITQDWVSKKRIPQQHGSVIEGTEEDIVLCKQCALAAVSSPYAVAFLE